ncbi:hypothetical protein Poli38472_000168 [Pythium oligandrum]|uniref:ABC transporter domain-containing protein n=1 Tax=Pythium oligandrum TaxID=41045 RepID=A0A8K1CB87_PYTOL|nr:hypothetical protein Poli38472_000168 [Pythium oligandrum]|eukprot:TMW60126.1 hypothetical protein Poli38472_000168 [Pythium oligandrum]
MTSSEGSGALTGLLASIRVLFWKHWRTKQREGFLNRRRATTPGVWLFPPLVTDIILPLVVVLYLIQIFCGFNEEIGPITQQGLVGRQLASFAPLVTTTSAVTAMTALPLLLGKTNMTLAVLDRPENRAFLAYLDREYAGDAALGLYPVSKFTSIVPFNKSSTSSIEDIDTLLEKFPKASGIDVYMALDLRHPTPKDPLEARTFFFEDDATQSPSYASPDQVKHYFSLLVHDTHQDRFIRFPGPLPIQMELNRFLRIKDQPVPPARRADDRIALSPTRACRTFNSVLDSVALQWTDLPSSSPLGKSVASCIDALKQGRVGPKTLLFLVQLIEQTSSNDELQSLHTSLLPKRPQKIASGQLETNIVFYMAYLFLWPYNRLIRDIVMEKEKQLKEYLLIMGLPPMALLISWFLLYLLASVIIVAIAVVMLSGSMFTATQASAWHFFMLLMIFATSMLLFAIAITPIFNQTRTAAAAAPLLYMVLGVAPFLHSLVGEDEVDNTPLHYVVWLMEQISSPVVFMEALHGILALDAKTGKIRPIEWATVADPSAKILVQSIGYLILGWYLENVFPRTFGVQRKWYFVFQPSYWFPGRAKSRNSSSADADESELRRLTEAEDGESGQEEDSTLREMSLPDYLHHFRPILFVKSLAKRYPNGKLAVQNVSFGVKKGEIFGLLGPNGAGKSTTMSILCGMLAPTAGDAFVGSTSVVQDPVAIRKNLSVCFQQNILFDELTVWEHLQLVYALKTSLGIKAVHEELWVHKLQQFGLEEKRDALSKTLSGGQKRKLSLVLALMDTSRVVLLDEPTAGMDLKARLDTWDALKKAVHHRAVILTTHSMQEAQALCENIGIVAEGRLKCCGSSLFLREKFGVGYKLTVVHAEGERGAQFRADTLLSAVRKYVPTAVIVSDNKWETRIQLNDDDPAKFLPFFDELEQMKRESRIKRYAMAATDLEDVFVKVTEGGDVYYHAKDDQPDFDVSSVKPTKSSEPKRASFSSRREAISQRLTDIQALPTQLRALLLKRWRMAIRDKRAMFAQYVWPLVLFAIFLALARKLSAANRSETITSLPSTASHSSLYIGTLPSMSESMKQVINQFSPSDQARISLQDASTPAEMLDSILNKHNETTYFSAVFVQNMSLSGSPMLEYTAYYNQSIVHSLPVALEWMSGAYCKAWKVQNSPSTSGDCELSVRKSAFPIRASNLPMSGGSQQVVRKKLESKSKEEQSTGDRMTVAFYLLFTMSSITSNYATAVVKERESGLKRLQYMHLASLRASMAYWVSHFVFDYVVYVLATIAIFVITAAFSFTWSVELMVPLVITSFVYGIAVLVFSYALSFAFSSHSSAQSVLSYVSLFQLLGTTIVFALAMIPGICEKANTATLILEILPLFAYGRGVLNLATSEWTSLRTQCLAMSSMTQRQRQRFENASPMELMTLMKIEFGTDEDVGPWDWAVTGRPLTYLVLSSLVYMLLLFVFDTLQMYPTVLQNRLRRVWNRSSNAYTSIATEHDPESPNRNIIEVEHLTKVYNPKKKQSTSSTSHNADDTTSSNDEDRPVLNQSGQVVAVDDVSFTVERNDCVALLGVNGSGKSTTFEVLTSGIAPTSGRARIDGIDVTLEPQLASRQYGYCPQTNIFFNEMTVREHLELFHRLRSRHAFAHEQEAAVVHNLLSKLDLFPVEKTTASNLSGGNKRRLMLALSMLSDDVALLLMDEPSAGVDVVARRLMWRVLHDKRQKQSEVSCLFTTHSMEEAEAVCANAVVLNKGKMVWSGSIPELKHHAARGISISLRLNTETIWDAEKVRYYTEKVRRMLAPKPNAKAALDHDKIVAEELENAWTLCRQYHPRSEVRDGPRGPGPHGTRWIASLLARLENEQGPTVSATTTSAAPTSQSSTEGMDIAEFVKEWLIQESFATIEMQLFDDLITVRSGEEVNSVALQNTSGSNTTGIYETNCTDKFTLADAFKTMETHKSRFAIARYSISELSLERVFEQFT